MRFVIFANLVAFFSGAKLLKQLREKVLRGMRGAAGRGTSVGKVRFGYKLIPLTDKDPFLRRAAAEGLGRARDSSELSALQMGAGNDPSEMVRAAMAFALQKLGRNYIPRLVESLDSEKMAPQIADYLLELGPSVAPALVSHLQDPSPAIRANVATVLGALGDAATVTALQPLTGDKDRSVAQAATRAIDRLKHRAQLPKSSSSL